MNRGMPVPSQPSRAKPASRSQNSPVEVIGLGIVIALGALPVAYLAGQWEPMAGYIVAGVGAWIGSVVLLVGVIAKGVEIGLRNKS